VKVINLFGGPGSGKSTIAAGIFYNLKRMNHHAELVTEYAKDLVYDNNLENMMEYQEVIFAEQNKRLQRLEQHDIDWVVTDSPICLSDVYAVLNAESNVAKMWQARDIFIQLVHEQFRYYDNINVFLDRPNMYQEYGRNHNLDQAVDIDNRILYMLDTYGYPYKKFKVELDIVDDIIDWVEEFHT